MQWAAPSLQRPTSLVVREIQVQQGAVLIITYRLSPPVRSEQLSSQDQIGWVNDCDQIGDGGSELGAGMIRENSELGVPLERHDQQNENSTFCARAFHRTIVIPRLWLLAFITARGKVFVFQTFSSAHSYRNFR